MPPLRGGGSSSSGTEGDSESMHISKWVDESPPSHTLTYLDMIFATRLSTTKALEFSSRAKQSRETQFNRFVNSNKSRDAKYKAW